jgi:Tfp pilus assembly protein PilV
MMTLLETLITALGLGMAAVALVMIILARANARAGEEEAIISRLACCAGENRDLGAV